LFNPETGKFIVYTSENSGLGCNNVISLFNDRSGDFWAGTFWCNGGVNRFDRKTNRFIPFNSANSDLSENTVFSIYQDYYGVLWMGTNAGLNCFNKELQKFNKYLPLEKDSSSLSQETVMSIIESPDSTLWVGTADGLNKFDRKTQKFKRFYELNGLAGNYIEGMEIDKSGHIWIGTNKGISKFNPKTEKFINFNASHGLQGNEFFRCSHYKDREGYMYFGGTNGFNTFNPEEIKEEVRKPRVVLTDFTVFNQQVSIGGKISPLKKYISEADNIVLAYNQNSFTLEFAALNFISPEETRYAYKLEGFDKNWIFSGSRRVATYTNISPGRYTFRVKVPMNSGIANEEGTSILIEIKPPYWQTWWFRLMAILFITFSLFGFFAYRVRTEKEQNRLLSQIVSERTRELQDKNDLLRRQSDKLNETNTLMEERQQRIEEQSQELLFQKNELQEINAQLKELNATKDKFFSIIAHDIKNPFNSILGFTELLKSQYDKITPEKRKLMIDALASSSNSVYQLLENLLQWSRSQRGILEFKPENIKLKSQIGKILPLLTDTANHKSIEIESHLQDENMLIYADPQMLDTIIRNLVSNAIKFTKNGGRITISAEKTDKKILIKVTDTGIGMSPETIRKIFKIDSSSSTLGTNRETGTGLGLILVKEFVTRHKGKISIESKVDKGSTFTVYFPIPEITIQL
jgi:signal transduction histidine kinase